MALDRRFPALVAGLLFSSLAGCGDADLGAMAERTVPRGVADGEEDSGGDGPSDVDPFDGDDGEDDDTDAPGLEAGGYGAAGPVIDGEGAPDEEELTPKAAPKPLEPFRVMTYNVRRPTTDDTGIYAWSKRKAAVIARILANNPDIVGVQEASNGADKDLIAGLTGDDKPYAVFRPSLSGSPKLVFYKKTRFVFDADTGMGNVALPNPYAETHECHSNAKGRKAAWVGLREKDSQKVFFVVNAHITHGAKCSEGRKKQVEAIKKLVETNGKGLAKIVMGDFNTDPQSTSTKGETTISILEKIGLKKTATFSGTTTKTQATFNSDWKKKGWKSSTRLDYIFHSGGDITSTSPTIDRTTVNGITPSDHYAVLATIRAAN